MLSHFNYHCRGVEDRLLRFSGGHGVPGEMIDVVRIPVEAYIIPHFGIVTTLEFTCDAVFGAQSVRIPMTSGIALPCSFKVRSLQATQEGYNVLLLGIREM